MVIPPPSCYHINEIIGKLLEHTRNKTFHTLLFGNNKPKGENIVSVSHHVTPCPVTSRRRGLFFHYSVFYSLLAALFLSLCVRHLILSTRVLRRVTSDLHEKSTRGKSRKSKWQMLSLRGWGMKEKWKRERSREEKGGERETDRQTDRRRKKQGWEDGDCPREGNKISPSHCFQEQRIDECNVKKRERGKKRVKGRSESWNWSVNKSYAQNK